MRKKQFIRIQSKNKQIKNMNSKESVENPTVHTPISYGGPNEE